MANAAPQAPAAPQAQPTNVRPGSQQAAPPPPPAQGTPAAPGVANAEGAPPAVEETPVQETPPLSKAREAAKKAREGAAKNRAILQEKDRTAAQAAQIARENQALRQQLQMSQAQFQQFQQAYMQNPQQALRMLGMTEEQLARQFISNADPNKQITDLRAEVQRLLQKDQEAAQKAQQEEQERQRQMQVEANRRRLISHIETNADKYPLLAEQPPSVIIPAAIQAVNDLSHKIDPNTGLRVDTSQLREEDIAFILESLWENHGKAKKSKAAPKADKKPEDDKAAEDPKEDMSGAPEKKPAIKTLTNKLAQQKFTWPKNFDNLSDREQKKVMAEYVRSMNMAK